MENKYFDYKDAAQKVGTAFSVIYVLYSKKIITWFSSFPSKIDESDIIPVVMWQYKDGVGDVEYKIKLLVEQKYKSVIDWYVEGLPFNNRWRLTPKKVYDLMKREEVSLRDALSIMAKNDPGFALKANRDLLHLADFLNLNI